MSIVDLKLVTISGRVSPDLCIKLHRSLRRRSNKWGISQQLKKYGLENIPMIASRYMDYCIDEEGIDTLISFGGDPNFYTCDLFTINNKIDLCRTIIRRLFHGARYLPYNILKYVFDNKDKFMSTLEEETPNIPDRSNLYYEIECSKLSYFLETFPGIFTKECTNNEEWFTSSSDLLQYPSTLMYYIFRDNQKYSHIYMFKCLTIYDWVDLELKFGRHFRRKGIIVSVLIRNSNNLVSKKTETFDRMSNLGYDLSSHIIGFL